MAGKFVPFDPRAEFTATQRNLPHWHQPGATYFVTFRLADSLPVAVRGKLAEMQRLNASDAFDWIGHYLDAGIGDCTLKDSRCAELVEETLRYFDGARYELGSFVVMPNHVHVLVRPISPATLSSVVHTWKSYSSHIINRHLGRSGALWQKESFDRIVRDQMELRKFDDYIVANPTEAKLTSSACRIGRGLAAWFEG